MRFLWSKGATVHPHACGEIFRPAVEKIDRFGTSPRLWGDFPTGFLKCLNNRYIPTLVGRFRQTPILSLFTPVHPHACGEIISTWRSNELRCGTSPRLWGDSDSWSSIRRMFWYIPTLVGRLKAMRSYLAADTVHPHACGEIRIDVHDSAKNNGTSPRLWGDWTHRDTDPPSNRYIPTLVGRLDT